MSREDFYHKHFRNALLAAGWKIESEHFRLPFYDTRVKIDFTASKQENGVQMLVAVEVKNFRETDSYNNEFQRAVGQYLLYRDLLTHSDFTHQLFLGVPMEIYQSFFSDAAVKRLLVELKFNLVTFDPETVTLVQWIPHNTGNL